MRWMVTYRTHQDRVAAMVVRDFGGHMPHDFCQRDIGSDCIEILLISTLPDDYVPTLINGDITSPCPVFDLHRNASLMPEGQCEICRGSTNRYED